MPKPDKIYKSDKKHPKADVWATEFRLKTLNASRKTKLNKLIALLSQGGD